MTPTCFSDFALGDGGDIPESALNMAALLLADTLGVAAGAALLDVSCIARDLSLDLYAAGVEAWSAPFLFDGRRASMVGAAYAAATQIDNLDAHDGYNPTRGHIGCAIVPALFAFAERCPKLSGRDALKAMVVGYEIAARAGLALHATVSDYHTSGAWNGLGVASMGCRLLGADSNHLRQAVGIAEYHGPRSQMMREIDNPSMLHDGSGMGALVGVTATLAALRGFEGAPAITIEADDVAPFWSDLGTAWTIESNYIKPYPICRWAHAAIDAVWRIRREIDVSVEEIAEVRIGTFRESSRLFAGMPASTSEAQYSLAFSVATMLVKGRISPMDVQGVALADPVVGSLLGKIKVEEVERHSARFPEGRWSDVRITLKDGRSLNSGDVNARGGPEEPMSLHEVKEKFHVMAEPGLNSDRADALWSACLRMTRTDSQFTEVSGLAYSTLEMTT